MAAGIAIGSSGIAPSNAATIRSASDSSYAWGFETEYVEKSFRSGDVFMSYSTPERMRYRASISDGISMSSEEKVRQYRYKSIERSFLKNSDGLPGNKMGYMEYMANVMCCMSFYDNICSFNKYDETIDSIFKMSGDLTLTMSQFLDEDVESPVVFSIHRGEELLVSAEMRLDDLAKTVNEILISESSLNVK